MEAARVHNAILTDYLTSVVALEESEIRSPDPNIPMDNHFTDDKLYLGMRRGCDHYDNEGDKIDQSDAVPTASRL